MSLTDHVIMPGNDYKAICDSVRSKTGGTEPLKSGEVAAAIDGIQAGGASGPVKRCCVRYSEGEIYPYFVEGMTWADLIDSTHNAIFMTAAFVDYLYQPVFAVTERGTVKIAPTGEQLAWEAGTVTTEVYASETIMADYSYYTM